jgi:hypothetical protein
MKTIDGNPGTTDCTKRYTARPSGEGLLAPGRVVTTGDQRTSPETSSSASVAALAPEDELCAATDGVRSVPTAIAVKTMTATGGLLTKARAPSMRRGLVRRAASGEGIDSRSIGATTSTSSNRWTTSAVSDQWAARSSSGHDSVTTSAATAAAKAQRWRREGRDSPRASAT